MTPSGPSWRPPRLSRPQCPSPAWPPGRHPPVPPPDPQAGAQTGVLLSSGALGARVQFGAPLRAAWHVMGGLSPMVVGPPDSELRGCAGRMEPWRGQGTPRFCTCPRTRKAGRCGQTGVGMNQMVAAGCHLMRGAAPAGPGRCQVGSSWPGPLVQMPPVNRPRCVFA